jgi:tetratricopeptide (TPR) repeat protein
VSNPSQDHLMMTTDLAYLMFFSYTKRNEALQEMEVEYRAWLNANNGVWPHVDNEPLGRYVVMLQHANQHSAGETLLKARIATPENDEQRKWLDDQLFALYNHALEHDGAVSMGTGRAKLLKPLVELNLKSLAAAQDEYVRYNLVTRLSTAFEIASRHKIPGAAELLRSFAFETMPKVLPLQQQHYANTARSILQPLFVILGSKETLRYLVERIEQWPQRFEIQYQSAWNMLGYDLAFYRQAVGASDLDGRILKLAINRLKADLRNGESGSRYLINAAYTHFWNEKTADFAKAAEEVLNERRGSGRRAMTVAVYLRSGLLLRTRSCEVLLVAHSKGLLGDNDQFTLVSWLHEENRYAEMIPLLEPLVAAHPDQIKYRTELMVAYFHAKRPEQLIDLIAKTDAHFHQGGLWIEANVDQFARGCQGSEQWEPAQNYFIEAIALHQRANPGSGLNDSQLSDDYQQLARVESRLGHTEAAVTAASAAIVCWDMRHQYRQTALNVLQEVLTAAKDLDEYVKHLDAQSSETHQESPLLRKEIGKIYQQRNEFAKAITQLKLAVELQPNDSETRKALMACYDATGKRTEATQQLMDLIDVQPHDLALYQQLAQRLKDNEPEAERAATSIIESSPNEAESHTALAELRETQGRWDEAIPQWEQVAQLRKLEPTGLLRLARAQIHEKQWDAAKKSIDTLKKTDWPSRFSNVGHETLQLQNRIPR